MGACGALQVRAQHVQTASNGRESRPTSTASSGRRRRCRWHHAQRRVALDRNVAAHDQIDVAMQRDRRLDQGRDPTTFPRARSTFPMTQSGRDDQLPRGTNAQRCATTGR